VILVDTHVVAWLALDQHKISRRARTAIDGARKNAEGLAISGITLLELATLQNKGRIRLDISLESFLEEVESRFVVLPISARACARAMALPATLSVLQRWLRDYLYSPRTVRSKGRKRFRRFGETFDKLITMRATRHERNHKTNLVISCSMSLLAIDR